MPPYFAVHPPVYYSGQIVRIPYGASPFASPWGPYGIAAIAAPVGVAPAIAAVAADPAAEPITIQNEFYKRGGEGALPAPKSKPASQRSQVHYEHGLMIDNPFYQPHAQFARRE
jgi:hypothetical protein